MSGELTAPPESATFSYKDFLARQGIYSMIDRPRMMILDHDQGSPIFAAILAFRGRAREVITQILPEPQASLLNGILLGDDAGLPAGGQVVEGESDVNEAMITGESLPVRKAPGVKVIGGSIVGDSSLRVRVSAIGEQTALAGIMRLVREAQQSKSRTQILADRAAGWLFYLSLGVALASASDVDCRDWL